MASVWIERDDLRDYGFDPDKIEETTGRRIEWAEVYSGWADNLPPELEKFTYGPDIPDGKRIMVGIHVYFCYHWPGDAECVYSERAEEAAV